MRLISVDWLTLSVPQARGSATVLEGGLQMTRSSNIQGPPSLGPGGPKKVLSRCLLKISEHGRVTAASSVEALSRLLIVSQVPRRSSP